MFKYRIGEVKEMGRLSSKGKEGVWVEGRASNEHYHSDGTYGRDIYAAKVSYSGGEKVGEKDAGWGHVHEGSSSSSGGSGSNNSGK